MEPEVCVQDDKQVLDRSCRLFARNFFSALKARRTIAESFEPLIGNGG